MRRLAAVKRGIADLGRRLRLSLPWPGRGGGAPRGDHETGQEPAEVTVAGPPGDPRPGPGADGEGGRDPLADGKGEAARRNDAAGAPATPAPEGSRQTPGFRALGAVGDARPAARPAGAPPRPVVTVAGGPEPATGTPFVSVSRLDRLQPRVPSPTAVRRMNELDPAPLNRAPARFRAAAATDTEVRGEPALDLGDDLFSHVACVINLKIRQRPTTPEATEPPPDGEASAPSDEPPG